MLTDGRPAPDQALQEIADYVIGFRIDSPATYRIARLCLMDAIGCAIEALKFAECTRMLGPAVPGTQFSPGARVPGTAFELDPVSGAFNIATMIRWLDFNDALAAAQGGHPSDNLGAILAVADYLARNRISSRPPLVMRDVLTALVKCYEIHGVLSLENRLEPLGFDYVILPKVAAAAVLTKMLGGTRDQIISAVSNAWADGATLAIYRHGDNTGPRKSWAAGDAASRAVWLALLAMKGEISYPSVLSAQTYGFHDAVMRGNPLRYPRAFGDFVINNVIAFKFVPAGMQGQSAAECAFRLHPFVKDRLDEIAAVEIKSHERMMRIMNKTGPLTNPADRDHCAQYLIAVGMIHGHIGTQHFSDAFAADPRIDALRAKMTVEEEPAYTRDFHDPAKRSNTHAIRVVLRDGSALPEVKVEYPAGHPPLDQRASALVESKFRRHLEGRFPPERVQLILDLFRHDEQFDATPVDIFMTAFAQ